MLVGLHPHPFFLQDTAELSTIIINIFCRTEHNIYYTLHDALLIYFLTILSRDTLSVKNNSFICPQID